MASPAPSRRRLVIDTDGGCDDAIAILLALRAGADPAAGSEGTVEVLAITSVFGNVSMPQATENVFTLLRVFGRLDSIPFFAGAPGPLVDPTNRGRLGTWPGHGENGLGDASFLEGGVAHDHEAYQARVKAAQGKKHAAQVLIDLTLEHPQQIDLVCLGPLTNVALAARLDPTFPSRLRSFSFMGGSVWGRGNANLSAEFNFLCDPDAAHVALVEMGRAGVPCLAVPWEATESGWLSWAEFDLLTQGHEDHIPGDDSTKHALEASVLKKTHAKYELVDRRAAVGAAVAAATPESSASAAPGVGSQDTPLSPARDHALSADQAAALNEIPSLSELLRSASAASADPFAPVLAAPGAPVQAVVTKGQYVCCDAIALACLLVPSIIAHSERHHAQVTLLADEDTRGTLAIDWYDKRKPKQGATAAAGGKSAPYVPVTIVTKVHRERWLALMHSVFQGGRTSRNNAANAGVKQA